MGLEGALRVWGKAADGPARHPHAIRAARPTGPQARHRRGKPLASRALTLRALHGRAGGLPPWCVMGFSWPCASTLHNRAGRLPHPPGELIHPSAPPTDGFSLRWSRGETYRASAGLEARRFLVFRASMPTVCLKWGTHKTNRQQSHRPAGIRMVFSTQKGRVNRPS